jgi:hypothetical protein
VAFRSCRRDGRRHRRYRWLGCRVRAPDGSLLKLKNPDLQKTRFEVADGDWRLVLKKGRTEHRYEGEDARRVAGVVLSRINRAGARRPAVQDAVRFLDEAGSPEAVIHAAAEERSVNVFRESVGHPARLPARTRLAVEMALHEEQERRALDGELWRLERAWEEAEEIAAISDGLLLPEGAKEFLEAHKAQGSPEERPGRSHGMA